MPGENPEDLDEDTDDAEDEFIPSVAVGGSRRVGGNDVDEDNLDDYVRILIDSDMKEKWKREVAENPKYDSLSQLIRFSVSRELSGRYDQDSQVDELKELMIENIKVTKNIDRKIDDVNDEVATKDDLQDELSAAFDRLAEEVNDG